jgi:Nitroreductase
MDAFEAIAKRHSYRGEFQNKPVPRADLEKIVQAGINAPSGCNAQTTSFVVVDDPKLIAAIAKIFNDRPVCVTAQAVIVCLADATPAYGTTSFDREDCAAAVQNMLLAITALGYATVWFQGYVQNNGNDRKIAELLNVPGNLRVEVVLPLGVPVTSESPREKKPLADRVSFNKYGQK